MKIENSTNIEWLCRNCNTLVDSKLGVCPNCRAYRPEEASEEAKVEGITESVVVENYTNAQPAPKSKYTFREAVLVNAADIILVLGLFCTFGALIMPMFVEMENVKIISISAAILLFAFAMISWALLRTVADISRRLRKEEK
jgi:hypothetical protein